jgi:hypothetical protein
MTTNPQPQPGPVQSTTTPSTATAEWIRGLLVRAIGICKEHRQQSRRMEAQLERMVRAIEEQRP